MRTIEIKLDRNYLNITMSPERQAAQVVPGYVKYALKGKQGIAVILTRKRPTINLLDDYAISFNGEPCAFDQELPIWIRGIWFESRTDRMPKYVVANANAVKVDGKHCLAFFDPSEFTKAELFAQEEVPYQGLSIPGLMTVYPVHQSKNRVFCSDDGHVYESVSPAVEVADGVLVTEVGKFGLMLASESEIKKRWLVCEYPEGTWEKTRRELTDYPDAHWRKLPVYKLFDGEYLDFAGTEFKITRVSAK